MGVQVNVLYDQELHITDKKEGNIYYHFCFLWLIMEIILD